MAKAYERGLAFGLGRRYGMAQDKEDANGREHKPAGSPEGGQFTSKHEAESASSEETEKKDLMEEFFNPGNEEESGVIETSLEKLKVLSEKFPLTVRLMHEFSDDFDRSVIAITEKLERTSSFPTPLYDNAIDTQNRLDYDNVYMLTEEGYDEEEVEFTRGVIQETLNNAKVFTRMKEAGLTGFLTSWLKNQFETKTSNGSIDPYRIHEKGYFRAEASNEMFGFGSYDDDFYESEEEDTIDNRDRETYGYLGDEGGNTDSFKLRQYGMFAVEFKSSVKDRTTFSFGDSLCANGDLGTEFSPSRVNDYTFSNFKDGPSVASMLVHKTCVAKNPKTSYSVKELVEASRSCYLEAQFHGIITPEDIEVIHAPDSFRKNAGEGNKLMKILTAFQENGGNVNWYSDRTTW